MLFNSITFLIFFPLVFAGYWLVRERRMQNALLLVASYVFYGWWDWRFLGLIAFTSGWAYIFGLLKRSKFNVALSLVINLGILGVFKYYDFFADSLMTACTPLGIHLSIPTLHLVLPVGISFYTFQALSYTLDVYRGTVVPTRDPIAFFAFISFFPQLVAGPIERATNLLPQFLAPRRFDYALAVEGCRQMLWGFYKKIVVADTCAVVANATLGAEHPSSLSILCGILCFTFQIYGDFSGYSDIAIGCSKLFGIRLMRNFAHPYFSRDIAEFWRRWHISLTTWFRDYLYIPLGGSRCGTLQKIRNTFVIFLVSGFWHGANWTFVIWGAFHALCFVPLLIMGKNRKYTKECVTEERLIPRVGDCVRILSTFSLVAFGWIFFRAPTLSTAGTWIKKIVGGDFHVVGTHLGMAHVVVLPLVLMLAWEWISRGREQIRLPANRALRWCVYYLLIGLIVYWQPEPQSFIYFQF